ncbi:hypothetical protein JCM10212_002467 [Sporobolomyces blumeae]
MATLERVAGRAGSIRSLPPAPPPVPHFEPSAVPTAPPFSFPSTVTAPIDAIDSDLWNLANEPLFSGTRGARQPDRQERLDAGSSGASVPRAASAGRRASHLHESLGPFGEARRTFVLALDGILQSVTGNGEATPEQPSTAMFTDPFVDPSALLAPYRRSSIAGLPLGPLPSTSSRPSESSRSAHHVDNVDEPLANLVASLQAATDRTDFTASGPAMRSLEHVSPVNGPATDRTFSESTLLDELAVQVDLAANVLPAVEAELARTLVSLLRCIDRLETLSTSSPDPNEFSSADEEDRVFGAARDVERCERELLWGRVDDLSERVRALARQRVEAGEGVEEEDAEATGATRGRNSVDTFEWSPRSREIAFDAASLSSLPSYSRDLDIASPHLPPAYLYDPDAKESLEFDDHKPPVLPSSPSHVETSTSPAASGRRMRKMSSAQSEKMQRDLDSVSQAIERLYVVSPQLANQRVEPDRRVLRERQLAKLGNAIERLSQGRLNDQRAVSVPISTEPENEVDRKRREQEAVDRLIERIDKAASRTFANQRVELGGKRKAVLDDEGPPLQYKPLADPKEAQRREFILQHTGKGRLAGQDAVLHSSGLAEPFPGPPQQLDEPVTISEFFSDETNRRRPDPTSSSSSSVKSKSSTKNSVPGQRLGEPEPAPGRRGSLRIGVFRALGSRRGSAVNVAPASGAALAAPELSRTSSVGGVEVLDVPEFDWVTEESRNLGTLVVTFWPRHASSTSISSKEEYAVVAVELDSILVAPGRGGPASRLTLPCRIIPQAATVSSASVYHEIKLVTVEASPTKSRADLEVHVPLSTTELRQSMPVSFACAVCHTDLVDSASITRYNALPSEHWAELLDAWMCHPDQTLSQDLISKGKGIKPRTDEGLVGTSYIVFPRKTTKNWTTPEDSLATRAQSDDNLLPAHCTCCASLVGHDVQPLASESSTSFRLLKYAAYPLVAASPQDDVVVPEYSLASHVTAEMLETGQAHACHRFVVEDAEEEQPRLILWFFNPAVRIGFSSSSPLAGLLESPRRASAGTLPKSQSRPASLSPQSGLVSRSMNAVKVFYSVVSDPGDASCRSFLEHKTETVTYPRNVVDRLANLLRASSLVYPLAKRKFGDLDAGFLERI